MVAVLIPQRMSPPGAERTAELAAWAAALRGGDSNALPALMRVLEPRVLLVARDLTGDAHLAEDIAQETFLTVQQRINTYDPTYPFATWVLTIAARKAIDLSRGRTRRRRHLRAFWRGAPRRSADASSVAASQQELRRILDELLDGLPPRQRQAFVLRDLQALSIAETAAALDCSVGAVKSHLATARRKVRDLLAARYPIYLEDPHP